MIGKIIFILIAIGALFIEIFGVHYQTLNNGTHTGIITAIETSGVIFKTVTVYVKTDAMSSQEDEYCLIDLSLVPKLKDLEVSKSQVTIEFKDYLVKGNKYCDGEQGGIITGVKNGQ